jgi:CubicO group peptidase (beta-lactamase class C family)
VRVVFAAALAALMWSLPAAAQSADDSLIGIWAYRSEFNPGPAGELTVTREGNTWRAAIAGAGAQGVTVDKEVRFSFSGENGSYRGRLTDGGRTFDGMWRRREILDDPRYPEGAGQAYAMPVVLRRSGNTWRGIVRPLPDPFTLYLKIFRLPDGRLAAAFRNPEMHHHGPAMQLAVTRSGNTIRLSTDSENAHNGKASYLEATYVENPRRIRIYWQDMRRWIDLEPRTPEQAPHFFSRPPGSPPYVYQRPPETGDGWQTARAGEVGLDEDKLRAAVQRIIDVDPTAQRGAWLVHSMTLAYRGKLVLDEYFYGHDRETPHDTRSLGKTWGAVLVGAAMLEGYPISPSTSLYATVAPMGPFANPDPRKADITLAHVMTHTTGLACDDSLEEATLQGNEDVMQTQRVQPDWWRWALNLPLNHAPGKRYAYCSGTINLSGAMLTAMTKTSVPELFDRLVARPLGWQDWYWNVMPTGEGYLGGGTFVRTRDILKVGQVWLDGGKWRGRQIVPAAWIKESTDPHAHITPESTGRTPEDFNNFYFEGWDAYAWHRAQLKVDGQQYRVWFGNGNGGQLLIVIPDLELAAAFTAGNYRQGLWHRLLYVITGEYFVPAIKNRPPATTP